jgi:hypothetical protein
VAEAVPVYPFSLEEVMSEVSSGLSASDTAVALASDQRSLDAEDAARFRWMVQNAPHSVCFIAWREPAACHEDVANDPRKAIDAARHAESVRVDKAFRDEKRMDKALDVLAEWRQAREGKD